MSERKRLLFVHTGGTLGMTGRAPGPLAPSHYEQTVLPYVRGLEEIADIEGRVVCNVDSSDIAPENWDAIGAVISEEYDSFDGFVVLHGTDTMAFTASALSFALNGLSKPVVLTGSQRPIVQIRTDARINLVHAAICATMDIPEVGLQFGDHLYRGNRTTKISIQAYDAFGSPNHPPLVSMGVDVKRGPVLPPPQRPFGLKGGFSAQVAVLSLFPGISPHVLEQVAQRGSKAIVIRAFGEGNVPAKGWPEAIRAVTQKGVAVIVTSQCRQGNVVPGRYEGSTLARKAGALFGGDMTGETCVVKAMWLLGQGASGPNLDGQFEKSLVGEKTD